MDFAMTVARGLNMQAVRSALTVSIAVLGTHQPHHRMLQEPLRLHLSRPLYRQLRRPRCTPH
eukprot:781123-Prymnesium_polylepis.1